MCLAHTGVSDGVGGWSLSGIDAGEYSRLLMIMSKLFSESARTPPTPSQIMHSAYNQTQARRCTILSKSQHECPSSFVHSRRSPSDLSRDVLHIRDALVN